MPQRGIPLVTILIVLVAGCDRSVDPDQPVRLRLAHVYEAQAPIHAYGAAHLAEQLAASDVGLNVLVYPAAQLGNESELLEQLVAGELDLSLTGPAFLATWHEPIGLFDSAFAFEDLDHMLEVAHGEIGQLLWDELRSQYGVRVLDTWAYGSRHITSNRPIRHPEDLRGFRLRMPAARVSQASGQALGASPMPIPFSEVYLALQQGIADGQENPISTIQAMGFHEVQAYLNLSGHIQSSVQILINERTWQRLDAAQQEAVRTTIQELGEDVRVGVEREDREILQRWREMGALEVIDDVDVEAFRRRSREHFASGFPFSELYRQITSQPRSSPPAENTDIAQEGPS